MEKDFLLKPTTERKHYKSEYFEFSSFPYGPTEVYIHEHLEELQHMTVNNSRLNLLAPEKLEHFIKDEPDIQDSIRKAVIKLRQINSKLVDYPAFKLVHLTHNWNSWREKYRIANLTGQNHRDVIIPLENILYDRPVFSFKSYF